MLSIIIQNGTDRPILGNSMLFWQNILPQLLVNERKIIFV